MSTDLLPCPFCEEAEHLECKWYSRNTASLQHCVRCKYCKTEGLLASSKAKAIAAWNRRFVCLDKNGDKVYSDSTFYIWSIDALRFVWDSEFLRWRTEWIEGELKGQRCDAMFANYEIELIMDPNTT